MYYARFEIGFDPNPPAGEVGTQAIGDGRILKGLIELFKFLREIGVLKEGATPQQHPDVPAGVP